MQKSIKYWINQFYQLMHLLLQKVQHSHPTINMVHTYQNLLKVCKPSICHVKKSMPSKDLYVYD